MQNLQKQHAKEQLNKSYLHSVTDLRFLVLAIKIKNYKEL